MWRRGLATNPGGSSGRADGRASGCLLTHGGRGNPPGLTPARPIQRPGPAADGGLIIPPSAAARWPPPLGFRHWPATGPPRPPPGRRDHGCQRHGIGLKIDLRPPHRIQRRPPHHGRCRPAPPYAPLIRRAALIYPTQRHSRCQAFCNGYMRDCISSLS